MFRRTLITLIFVAVIFGCYLGIKYIIESKHASEQATQTIAEQIAAQELATANSSGNQIKYIKNIPTATTTAPSSWRVRSYSDIGLSIAYPDNIIARREGRKLILNLPRDVYFHWPLLDEVRITISASSTCAEMETPANETFATTTFSLNGYSFTAKQGDDVAAGNKFHEVIYMTEAIPEGMDPQCFTFDLFDRGANGAGLYVSDGALIDKYNNQHEVDFLAVNNVFNQIVESFRVR